MPVVELHRNHGVPLAAVRTWITLFRDGGREAVRAAAGELARVQRRPPSRAALEKLHAVLVGPANDERSRRARTVAVITVGVRRLHALADDIERLTSDRDVRIEALLTLGDLGDLERIDRVACRIDASYRGWVAGARDRALSVRDERQVG